jgi:hypothetical protein
MTSRRLGLGAMRGIQNDLRDARKEERALQTRIKQLEDAQAVLRGETPAGARKQRPRVTRADVLDYIAENPGAYYADIAEFFKVAPTTIGSHLSAAKKDGEAVNDRGRWSVINKSRRSGEEGTRHEGR